MNQVIFLIGFMGSGKSHWGKIWARENKMSFFDLDNEVEKITRETVANVFEQKGEDYFREMERYALHKFGVEKNFIMACGGGTPCFFDNMEWMNSVGSTILLFATPTQILDRILHETMERPLLKKINQNELFFFIEQKLKEREHCYNQAKHVLEVSTLDDASLSRLPFNKPL